MVSRVVSALRGAAAGDFATLLALCLLRSAQPSFRARSESVIRVMPMSAAMASTRSSPFS